MGTAKKQSRSKAKKSAARAVPAATRAKLETSAKGATRRRAAKSRATATGAKAKGRAASKVAPKRAAPAAIKKKTKSAAAKGKPKASAKPKAPRAVAKTGSARKQASPAPKKAVTKVRQRRDGSGRLDPKYARDLRALSRSGRDDQGDRAFFNRPRSGDDLAEELGEEAVSTMTSGEDQSDHLIGQEVEEERGGPFVKTRASDEFARGTDRSNPRDATREPFPRT